MNRFFAPSTSPPQTPSSQQSRPRGCPRSKGHCSTSPKPGASAAFVVAARDGEKDNKPSRNFMMTQQRIQQGHPKRRRKTNAAARRLGGTQSPVLPYMLLFWALLVPLQSTTTTATSVLFSSFLISTSLMNQMTTWLLPAAQAFVPSPRIQRSRQHQRFAPFLPGESSFMWRLHQTPPLGDDNDSSQQHNNKDASDSFVNGRNANGGDQPRQRQRLVANRNSTLMVSSSLETTMTTTAKDPLSYHKGNNDVVPNNNDLLLQQQQQQQKRITQLEELVARQAVDIKRLQDECRDLTEAAKSFAQVVELLREAGLDKKDDDKTDPPHTNKKQEDTAASNNHNTGEEHETLLLLDEEPDIFGTAPSDVMEAADAAGAAILAALLAGQQRLLVDVRDAELTQSAETLVQFIELAVLPVAAGLEGLRSQRNRLKLVFPTVKQLLQYRKTMALASPDVVALSTLNLDPVEPQDNLVVIVAPSPDDEEGCQVMNQLLQVPNEEEEADTAPIRQPIVVLNPHMVPIQGPAASYEVAYHLRLLSVQYMSSSTRPATGFVQQRDLTEAKKTKQNLDTTTTNKKDVSDIIQDFASDEAVIQGLNDVNTDDETLNLDSTKNNQANKDTDDDDALESAMKHARQANRPSSSSSNSDNGSTTVSGTTRSMVIRAYPNPWHVFVDTSPDTDADFEIAATFDVAPSFDDVQRSIVECLEGSEAEDELVAQQMQEALEAGQLDRVTEMLGDMGFDFYDDDNDDYDLDDDDEDDKDDPWRRLYGIDSV